MDLYKNLCLPFYEMNKDELWDYLVNTLDYNDNTYPYLNHSEVSKMNEEELRKLVIEIVDDNESSTEV